MSQINSGYFASDRLPKGYLSMDDVGRVEPDSPVEGERQLSRIADVKKPSAMPGFLFG